MIETPYIYFEIDSTENVRKFRQILTENDLPTLKTYIANEKYCEGFPPYLIDAVITGIEKNAIECIKYIADQDNLFCIQLVLNAIIKISNMNPNEIRKRFDPNIFNELSKRKNLQDYNDYFAIVINTYNEMDVDN